MPALPVVPNVLKTDVIWSDSTKTECVNVHYWHYTPSFIPGDANTFAQHLWNAYHDNWFNTVQPDNRLALERVDVIDLGNPLSPPAGYVNHFPSAGTTLGLANATALIGWEIVRRYRGGRPRSYIPNPGGDKQSDDGDWSTATLNQVQTLGNAILGVAPFAGATMNVTAKVNVSYYKGYTNVTLPSGRVASRPTPRAAAQVDNIIGIHVPTGVVSQRRRVARSVK